jgi:thiol-disulfide isomerase/thioredoxin
MTGAPPGDAGDPRASADEPIAASITSGPPARPARRGVVGPFSGRQLLLALGVIGAAALVLVLVTRPIAPGAGQGVPTALPGATPFLVGEAKTGLRPGDLAPELAWTDANGARMTLTDLDGTPVRLADLRGKLVWINFWATWCPPCQAETPVLRDMDERYRDKGLAIVAVAVQETSVDNVRAYADRYELRYPIAFDASANAFDLYKVFALPTQFFVGPDGRLLEVVNGPLTPETAKARIDAWLPTVDGASARPGSEITGGAVACQGRPGERPDRETRARRSSCVMRLLPTTAWHPRSGRQKA